MVSSCNTCGALAQPNGEELGECTEKGCPVRYCSKACQQADWNVHKLKCPAYQKHACWICKKILPGTPVHRACGCRGEEGFAHLECLARYAQIDQTGRAQEYCSICEKEFHGEIRRSMAEAKAARTPEDSHSGDLRARFDGKFCEGIAHIEQGRFETAYECFREILDASRVKYGEQSMLFEFVGATSAVLLAHAACCLGRSQEALEWLEKVEVVMRNA